MTSVPPASPATSVASVAPVSDADLKKNALKGVLQQLDGMGRHFADCVEAANPLEASIIARVSSVSRGYRLDLKNGFDAELQRARQTVHTLSDMVSSLGRDSAPFAAFRCILSDPHGETGLAALLSPHDTVAQRAKKIAARPESDPKGHYPFFVARYFLNLILRSTAARDIATAFLKSNDALFEASLNLRSQHLPLQETWRDPDDSPLVLLPRKAERSSSLSALGHDLSRRFSLPGLTPETVVLAIDTMTDASDRMDRDDMVNRAMCLSAELLDAKAITHDFPTRRPRSIAVDPQGKVLPHRLLSSMCATLARAQSRLAEFSLADRQTVQELLGLIARTDDFDRSSRSEGTPWHQVIYLMEHYAALGELQSEAARLCQSIEQTLERLDKPTVAKPVGFTEAELDALEALDKQPAAAKKRRGKKASPKPTQPAASADPARSTSAATSTGTAEKAAQEGAIASASAASPQAPGAAAQAAARGPSRKPASPPQMVETTEDDQESWTQVRSQRSSSGRSSQDWQRGARASSSGSGSASPSHASRALEPQALQAEILQLTGDLLMAAEEEYDSAAPGLPMSSIVRGLCSSQEQERLVRIGRAVVRTRLNDDALAALLTTCVHPGTFRGRNRSLLEAAAMSASYHVKKHAPGERVEAYLQRAFDAFDRHYAQEVTYRSDSPQQRAKLVRQPHAAGAYAWDHRLFWFDDRS